jgi:poly-gamma-glutamate capsule biosynthesis protein CapA/YwtB (metallophosphatase superfamily)
LDDRQDGVFMPGSRLSRLFRLLELGLPVLLVVSGCALASGNTRHSWRLDHTPAVSLRVVDEAGAPVADATVESDGVTRRAGADGTTHVSLASGPTLATVSAPGHISEPVLVGGEDAGPEVRVRLLSDHGGKRVVLHAAGDVMFGRRYELGGGQDAPLIPMRSPQAEAEAVVDAVAPAFRLGDFRTVNLETVVSAAGAGDAYPKKRFILNSPPPTLAGLKRLGVDVPLVANNHTRDYLDRGITDTRNALAAAGFPVVGFADGDGRQQAYLTKVRNTSLALLAYTSVDGSFVNDQYPADSHGTPNDPDNGWQYESRSWGYRGGVQVPFQDRSIGQAWKVYRSLERGLSADEAGKLWASLVGVYPEMQDWVGRRGHQGAAEWDDVRSVDEIRQAATKATLTVVELHSGFQFTNESAANTRKMARAAIDAGADIVIGHHPHVLQGLEWYKGKLIAYSMGNFVFDQDFLSTFSSAFLRTVWEGDQLVEARLVPVELNRYRPRPATGLAARRTLLGVWEDSLADTQTVRSPDDQVLAVPFSRDGVSRPARLQLDHGTAVVTATEPTEPADQPVAVHLPPHADVPIAFTGLLRSSPPAGADANLYLGRDLFGWGHFNDDTADAAWGCDTHWLTLAPDVTVPCGPGKDGFLRLKGYVGEQNQARPVARIPLARHRRYQWDGRRAIPLDPAPTYTLRLRVRPHAGTVPFLRLVAYHFDDTNPTEDPESVVLHDIVVPVNAPADGHWHGASVEVSAAQLDDAGRTGNMVLIYAGAKPAASDGPQSKVDRLDLDDIEFVEWRPSKDLPDGWHPYDFVRNAGANHLTVTLQGRTLLAGH